MKTRLVLLLAVAVIGVIANPVSKQTTASDNKKPLQSESTESQTKHEESLNNGEQKNETIDVIETDEKSDPKDPNCDKVEVIIEESISQVDDTPNLIEDATSLNDVVQQEKSSIDIVSPDQDRIDFIASEPSPVDFHPPVPSPIALIPPEQSSIDFFSAQNPVDFEPPVPSPIDLLPHVPMTDGFQDDFPVDDIPFRNAMNTIQDEIMETAAGFVPTPLVFRKKNKNKPRRRFANRRHFRPNPYRRKFHFFYPYYGVYHPSSLRFY